ncbi:MAG: extradiol ring-cleavage dioxygenase [Candidatus Moranbacteria bacterium]|nr:extradiol ring-cleavage dioxygenase [Candidatus Moranbacteria bacterium]
MISFAAITPHPPIIVPHIGDDASRDEVKNTVKALEKLRRDLIEAEVETLFLISPHGPTSHDVFLINNNSKLAGNFDQFGFALDLVFRNDLSLVNQIQKNSQKSEFKVSFHQSELDYGALVPLYFLARDLKYEIVSASFSLLAYKKHFEYGKFLGSLFESYAKKIGVVASGDLSHRLTLDAPAGYSVKGSEFDETLIEYLKTQDIDSILNMSDNLIREAGECGFRSILILLGILESQKLEYKFDLLSYEGPFGVGYLVAKLI